MVLRGIVAGSEIDGAIEFGALDLVSHSGSRSESVAEERADAVLLENGYSEGGEFFGVEASVVSDEDGGLGGFCFDVFGDGGDGQSDGREGEVVGNKAAPAGGAKYDGGSGERRRSAHNLFSVASQLQPSKRKGRAKRKGMTSARTSARTSGRNPKMAT